MPTTKLLVRVALKLRGVYLARAALVADKQLRNLLNDYDHTLERTRAILSRAVAEGSVSPPLSVRRSLLVLEQAVAKAAKAFCRDFAALVPTVPDLRTIVDELRQLEEEFGSLAIDRKSQTISVVTEAIELEEVYLGAFAIQLAWPRLQRGASADCFVIEALDPHPAPSSDSVTHPHVRNGTLCAGDAVASIGYALEQGRLADAFCLVRSVLSHYNSKSPHVPLEDWRGEACKACGCCVQRDDALCCENCGGDYCLDCTTSCATCEATRCYECLRRCAVCERWQCANCLQRCASSQRECCRDCLRTCGVCGEEVAVDELDGVDSPCAACRHKAAALSSSSSANQEAMTTHPLSVETTHDPTHALS